MKDLKEAYLAEQQKAQEIAERFHALYPELTPNLFNEITSDEQQQLIEIMNLEMAKLNIRIDQAESFLFERFLQQIKPEALLPKPSELLAEIRPDQLSRVIKLEKDTPFEREGTSLFSLDTLEILPIKLTQCINQVDQHRRSLKLRFEVSNSSVDLRQLNGRRLTLQLAGRYLEAVGLWQALAFETREVLLNDELPLEIESSKHAITEDPYSPLIQFFRQPEQLLKIDIWPLYFDENSESFEISFSIQDGHTRLDKINEQNFRLNTLRMIQAELIQADPIEHTGCKLRYPIRLSDGESQLWKVQKVWKHNRENQNRLSLPLNPPAMIGHSAYCQIIHQYDQSFIELHNLKCSPESPAILSMDCFSYRTDFEVNPNQTITSKGKATKYSCKTVTNSCPAIQPYPQGFLDELNLMTIPYQTDYDIETLRSFLNAHCRLATHRTHNRHWANRTPFCLSESKTKKAARMTKESVIHGLTTNLIIDDDYFPSTADADLLCHVMATVLTDVAFINNFHELSTQQLRSGIQRAWKS